jgi:hypothetical protein
MKGNALERLLRGPARILLQESLEREEREPCTSGSGYIYSTMEGTTSCPELKPRPLVALP